MKINIEFLKLFAVLFFLCATTVQAQSVTDTIQKKKYQAKPPKTIKFGNEAFKKSKETVIRWTGADGFLINSRGTTIMVDPMLKGASVNVLKGFDAPVMIEFPIAPTDVPKLDAVLITHSDNDHYDIPTLTDLAPHTKEFHSTIYVDSLMKSQKFNSFGHNIGDIFYVGNLKISLTPADHDWQNSTPGVSSRHFKKKDCTGYWIETPDGSIWAEGDSKLLPEHLRFKTPDAILFDFSDNEWHFTLEGALKIAAAYPNTPLLLSHWGTFDAPDFTPFNADPAELIKRVVNPGRVVILAPGQPFTLKSLKKSK